MRYIHDEKLLERLLVQEGVQDHFETRGLSFRLVEYEKGELICAPGKPLEDILFTVRGTVQVYSLREDGGRTPISRGWGARPWGPSSSCGRGCRCSTPRRWRTFSACPCP